MSEAEADETGAVDEGPLQLVDVLKAFSDSYDRATTDDERREAGLQQLYAITLCLQQADVPSETLRPLTALMHGLIDLDRGCLPPILQKKRRTGAPPKPSDDLRQRGLAAAAVTLLMHADKRTGNDGQKLERAVRRVAPRVKHWRAARRWKTSIRSQSLSEALKDWREEAMGGDPKTDWDAGMYAAAIQKAAASGLPPAMCAEWLLTKGPVPYR